MYRGPHNMVRFVSGFLFFSGAVMAIADSTFFVNQMRLITDIAMMVVGIGLRVFLKS